MTPILSQNYYVRFNGDAYEKLNEMIMELNPSTLFILVDENTHDACLPMFLSEIHTTKRIEIIEIESGEENKNLDTCSGVWNVLTELGADRKSLMLNLGGGVITDLGGFVASTFKRGIKFINIPTTLLSMVDASVGGKTGVDLGVLKNQIGLFSDPEMVIIDDRFLETLPDREIRSGLAEVIKYGLSYDKSIWEKVQNLSEISAKSVASLIHRSIEIKNEVVTEDPFEKGLRKVLNFGHTLGHAVESYYLESEHKENLTHGEAIVIGMITESYISSKLLGFPSEEVENINNHLLDIYGKVSIEESDYQAILDLLIHDKKNVNGVVNFVLLKQLEDFALDCKVPANMLVEALEFYNS